MKERLVVALERLADALQQASEQRRHRVRSVEEAAEYLGLHPASLYRLIYRKQIAYRDMRLEAGKGRKGGIGFLEEDLEEFLRRRRKPAQAADDAGDVDVEHEPRIVTTPPRRTRVLALDLPGADRYAR